MQALYQWQLTAQEIDIIDAQFLSGQDMGKADVGYFRELLQQIPVCMAQIDEALQPYLDRPIAQVDPVERAILWLAAYELLYRPDLPYRVVLNEAVELAKRFGAQQGHRFINGVLDKAAHKLRNQEVQPIDKAQSASM